VALAARELVRHRRVAALAVGLGAVALAAGCGGSAGGGDTSGKLDVVASTTVVADWARQVGGAHVQVRGLLGANVDPHDFEPSTDEADAVAGADVLLASGAGLDTWMQDLASGSGSEHQVVTVAPTERLRPPALAGASHEELDPHFWHDPTLAGSAVRRIERALADADPGHAGAYRANAGRYLARLGALDRELRRRFATVPAAERTMVTNHDAFGYLARRYGIRIVGAAIPSTAEAAEPSARQTARLVDTIRREHVRAVFAEATASPKLVQQLARETGARVEPGLYGDALGPPGSGADTYVRMMRHNAALLVRGFRA
jgi:ABC-type Zn uptake system ZnuABC Zn-binding protein ZnuA